MKSRILLTLLAISPAAFAQAGYQNFIRQYQNGTNVTWDMPVASEGKSPSALELKNDGALFQLWTIKEDIAKDYLLDQKLVGTYLPKADITIKTNDTYTSEIHTRVDQPFTVEIDVDRLLTGNNLPLASTKVLVEQHIANYPADSFVLEPTAVVSNKPHSSSYISKNGKTILSFPASSLKGPQQDKVTGEEHFVVHALSDGNIAQTQIASAKVKVWPIASGEIIGLEKNGTYRMQLPTVQIVLKDLYPRSDTYFKIYEGNALDPAKGVDACMPIPRDWTTPDRLPNPIIIKDLSSKISKGGTYTVALFSTTVYGSELLCEPITFNVTQAMEVNALQVQFTENAN